MRTRKGTFRVASAAVAASTFLASGLQTASAYQRPGVTERVSVASGGAEGHNPFGGGGGSSWASISGDGRYVAFESDFDDLVPNDNNNASDVFLKDRKTDAIRLVSASPSGLPATGQCLSATSHATLTGSHQPSISENGRFISFASCADNLVPGDTNLAMDVFAYNRRNGGIQRASVSSEGTQAAHRDPTVYPGSAIGSHALSATGRFVVFGSQADNLVDDDTNDDWDFFVHDLTKTKTEIASVSSDGVQQNRGGPSTSVSHTKDPATISAGGRFVGFWSPADNLVEADQNNTGDVFVHDRKTKSTELASVASDGAQQRNFDSDVSSLAVSANGRFVAFSSGARNLVPNDSNGGFLGDGDVFVRDRKLERTLRVSVAWTGANAKPVDPLFRPADALEEVSISRTGRYVSFAMNNAMDLVPGDDRSALTPVDLIVAEAYVHDLNTGATEAVSWTMDGSLRNDPGSSKFPRSISSSGRYVAFDSLADNLAPDDNNGTWDVFVHDRGPVLGVGGFGGSPPGDEDDDRICIEGTCIPPESVWIEDSASDAGASKLGAAGELLGARITYRPLLDDVFVVLELESMPRSPALAAGTAGTVYGMSFELDGRAYEIRSASTGLGPSSQTTAAFGLFSCPEEGFLCTKVSNLRGGFGTTGERITFSVPLADLGIKDGSIISDTSAYTALGTYLGGPGKVLDATKLP